MKDRATLLRWRLGIYAALVVTLLSIVPQASFWLGRGSQWHGAFYSYHPDEYPYAAYVNALIHGRPRRNDPYTGVVDQPNHPLPESIFSIQCVPAYVMAVPARLLGFSAATVFILSTPLTAFFSGLVVFWLVGRVTGDERIGAAAVLFVLCLGAVARGQFFVRLLGGVATPLIPFPFLRRYEPAFPFPFFFLFCGLLWIMLSTKNRRVAYWSAFTAGLTFAFLVFSYYFLWTAAAALLASLIILWVVIRPEGYRSALPHLALVGGLCLLALLPYAILLSRRARVVDTITALTLTRTPDLFRPLTVLCILLLVLLAWAAWRQLIARKDPAVVFTAALAITPLVLFNQQVVTGRSLQPVHYEQFIANYLSLLALLLTVFALVRGRKAGQPKIPALVLTCIALVAFGRGIYEARLAATSRVNTIVDEFMPTALRLASLAPQQPIGERNPAEVAVVLYPIFQPADALPSVAPQSVLWAPHSFPFSTLSPAENQERYFQQLYYSGTELQKEKESSYARILFRQVLFGWDRAIPGLTTNARPITAEEEQAALQDYAAYVATFDRERAAHPTLSFAIASATFPPDLSRIDRWYERDEGERTGKFILYRLKLQP